MSAQSSDVGQDFVSAMGKGKVVVLDILCFCFDIIHGDNVSRWLKPFVIFISFFFLESSVFSL